MCMECLPPYFFVLVTVNGFYLKWSVFVILEPLALQYCVCMTYLYLHTLSFHVADRIPSMRRVSGRSAGVGRGCSDAASEGRCVWAGRGHTGRMWWWYEHSASIAKVPFLETRARVWDAGHATKRSCVLGDGCSPRSSAYTSARRDLKWPSSHSDCFRCFRLLALYVFSSLGILEIFIYDWLDSLPI